MSRQSVKSQSLEEHTEVTNRINDMLIGFQNRSRSIQAKDAFWFAFEYSRQRPDGSNIQAAWEEYKSNRDNIN